MPPRFLRQPELRGVKCISVPIAYIPYHVLCALSSMRSHGLKSIALVRDSFPCAFQVCAADRHALDARDGEGMTALAHAASVNAVQKMI